MFVLKIPYKAGNMKDREGLELGPDAIEKASKKIYMTESGTLPVIEFDEVKVDNGNIDESHKLIEKKVSEIEHFATLLGGDHSITLSTFKGFAKNKKNPGLILFDAHPDLMPPFNTHEDYLRSLIEENVLKPENIVLVGLRNSDKEELAYMKEKNIKSYPMKEFESESMREICDSVMAAGRNWSDLYISIDIDVLDPAFAPGTGHTEPGGMSTRDLLYFIHRLKKLKNLKMADIVEVNPKKDVNGITAKAAAKLLVELS